MNTLLITDTNVVYSKAPKDFTRSAVVCFKDAFVIVPKQASYPFRIKHDPVPSYNFPDNDVVEGVQRLIDSCKSEEELQQKLMELNQNNTLCQINFSGFKKAKVKKLFGTRSLKVSNNAMNYFSFTPLKKEQHKQLESFYAHLA